MGPINVINKFHVYKVKYMIIQRGCQLLNKMVITMTKGPVLPTSYVTYTVTTKFSHPDNQESGTQYYIANVRGKPTTHHECAEIQKNELVCSCCRGVRPVTAKQLKNNHPL
jgi:hypothetical protein